ncbi:MAG: YcxB family protein, partial [Planctomycetota bacterium]
MIIAQSQFSEEEVSRGMRIHFNKNSSLKSSKLLFGFIGILFFLNGIMYLIHEPMHYIRSITIDFVAGIIFFSIPFLYHIFISWLIKINIRKMPVLNKKATWLFDDKGISGKGEGFESSTAWQFIYSATISKEGLLIYPQENLFYWIPLSGFQTPEEFEAAQKIIITN